MGFFDKLKKITSGLFSTFTEADEAFFEELEETLILADLGLNTSVDAVEQLRKKVKSERISGQDEVRQALREILAEKLTMEDQELNLATQPSVILVISSACSLVASPIWRMFWSMTALFSTTP